MNTTESIFNTIMESSVFRTNGPDIDLMQSLIDLSHAIQAEEETNWCLGEGLECCLDDLIIGAYWALTEWHGGQWSPEYATLCVLGEIFNPGMSCGPEEDSGAEIAKDLIDQYFRESHPIT